nr:oxygen-independent coproporphyrinogen III oxidase [Oryzicola mucosus]
MIDKRLIEKYSVAVPRYTSYPTAPHFHTDIGALDYKKWLSELATPTTASLYIHIPYCDRLCWFCACHTKQVRQYSPVARYLDALFAEIATVGSAAAERLTVTALHLGGGSPTMLEPTDMLRVGEALRRRFTFSDAAEISVEMDPNDMDEARYDALARMGMTRTSMGVQDFDERVQKAINREQSFEQTQAAVDAVRVRGVRSVNLDMLYGLPFQTLGTITETTGKVLSLRPDRIALFGYAHVPWMKKHQTMIDEAALPNVFQRFEQATRAAEMIIADGYIPVGIDHFALPGDTLAQAACNGTMRRNFQGYTVELAEALIGLGASAIGLLPQGYVQNMPATGEYEKLALSGSLATVRGFALTAADRMRAWIIERLMCDFSFSRCALLAQFGDAARPLIVEAEQLVGTDRDGLIVKAGNRYVVTPQGRIFIRSIAAHFDAYLGQGSGRHSVAV